MAKDFVHLLAILAILMTACTFSSGQFYDTGISDEEYISIASTTEEARNFLTYFPRSEIYVDRSGALAVDFRVTWQPISSTSQEWHGIRLRVFINPRKNQPTDIFLQCDRQFVKMKIIRYLDHYQNTHRCP